MPFETSTMVGINVLLCCSEIMKYCSFKYSKILKYYSLNYLIIFKNCSLKYLTISAQWLPLELFWVSEPTLEERKVLGSARNPLYFTKITKMIDCNAAADKDQTFCRTQVSWKVKLKCQSYFSCLSCLSCLTCL